MLGYVTNIGKSQYDAEIDMRDILNSKYSDDDSDSFYDFTEEDIVNLSHYNFLQGGYI